MIHMPSKWICINHKQVQTVTQKTDSHTATNRILHKLRYFWIGKNIKLYCRSLSLRAQILAFLCAGSVFYKLNVQQAANFSPGIFSPRHAVFQVLLHFSCYSSALLVSVLSTLTSFLNYYSPESDLKQSALCFWQILGSFSRTWEFNMRIQEFKLLWLMQNVLNH